MNKRRVTRVRIEAPVTSFRYPFFQIGRQVTYDMPPPSTIYGHVASAAGEFPDPGTMRFAYHFTASGKARDVEYQHVIFAGGSKFGAHGSKWPIAVQGSVQPQERDFLFQARMTLYLDGEEWAEGFRRPAFCVVLGRSQDLAEITRIDVLDLDAADSCYLENTLLPFSWRPRVSWGSTVQMPQYIEPPPARFPHFQRYIALRDRVFDSEHPDIAPSRRVLREAQELPSYWVDPDSEEIHGSRRGLVFHTFVD